MHITGSFVDNIRCGFKKNHHKWEPNFQLIQTDFGVVRVFDTKENKPVIINVPDGPNVIEHQLDLITSLSKNFRIVCFEFPGLGFSYPNAKFDYSFDIASKLIINILDVLKIDRAALAFSCSNGFYAIKAAQEFPDRIHRLFLSQTPSTHAMEEWTKHSIPGPLKVPIVGQLINAVSEKKFAKIWYHYALPKNTDGTLYQDTAIKTLKSGGCFCLSSLVQGLQREITQTLALENIPTTLIWGGKDFTHRNTDKNSILEHIPNCEIIEFADCGHFPELEQTEKYVKLLNERF
ncbi:alpha/beta fold hydrolase [Tenacibaculum amylolyticum]|uniref:alpha/beta fold hydrolase n=1 Tax=Tenacibaculum amylolyticum TaxID=104269 RepID=UPI00389386F6